MPSGTVTIGGIDATIYFGEGGDSGPAESIAEGSDGPRAEVTFECDYASRYQFLKGLCGSASGGPGGIVRTVPWAYPPSPNLYPIAVSSIRGVGWKWDAGLRWPTAKVARITTTFGVPKFSYESSNTNDPTGLPWTTTRFRITAEFLKPTYGGTFYWTDGGPQNGKPVPDSGLSLILPHSEVSIQRHWCPYIPIHEALEYAGSVNSAPITLSNYTFPVGTILFVGMNATETADTIGNRVFEDEYIFVANYLQRWSDVLQSDGFFYPVNTDPSGSGDDPYPEADLFAVLP
jgi:hypothetical protein